MNEVILIRCGRTGGGESLYRLTVDGREVSFPLTLDEAIGTIGALRMVEEAEEGSK